jgi:hypothetical protein
MGMDVYGEKPSNPKGEYFRNNVWYWRPLWDYVYDQCSDFLSEEDHVAGHYNDAYLIIAEKAEKISLRLRALCASGQVLDAERAYQRQMKIIPDETCKVCKGTGKRTDMEVASGCNACGGKGIRRPIETWYCFDAENVLKFAEFCEASGGFRIN